MTPAIYPSLENTGMHNALSTEGHYALQSTPISEDNLSLSLFRNIKDKIYVPSSYRKALFSLHSHPIG